MGKLSRKRRAKRKIHAARANKHNKQAPFLKTPIELAAEIIEKCMTYDDIIGPGRKYEEYRSVHWSMSRFKRPAMPPIIQTGRALRAIGAPIFYAKSTFMHKSDHLSNSKNTKAYGEFERDGNKQRLLDIATRLYPEFLAIPNVVFQLAKEFMVKNASA